MKKLNSFGVTHHLLLFALILFGITAFTGYRIYQTSSDSGNNSVGEIQDVGIVDELEKVQNIDFIKEKLKDEDGTIVGLSLEQNNETLVYEIFLSNKKLFIMNAITGEIIKTSMFDSEFEEGDKLPNNFQANITFAQARSIALGEFPQSKIKKIELDVEEGIVVVSVRFVDDARVDISIENGDIVRIKQPKIDNEVTTSDKKQQSSQSSVDKDDDDDKPEENDNEEDKDNEIRVEGTLTKEGGKYYVSSSGKKYLVVTSQDISNLVNKKVRVEGTLEGNTIKAEKIDER